VLARQKIRRRKREVDQIEITKSIYPAASSEQIKAKLVDQETTKHRSPATVAPPAVPPASRRAHAVLVFARWRGKKAAPRLCSVLETASSAREAEPFSAPVSTRVQRGQPEDGPAFGGLRHRLAHQRVLERVVRVFPMAHVAAAARSAEAAHARGERGSGVVGAAVVGGRRRPAALPGHVHHEVAHRLLHHGAHIVFFAQM